MMFEIMIESILIRSRDLGMEGTRKWMEGKSAEY
jgi:hypothetical protein